MKIDLHVHCSQRSGCARSEEAQQIQAAQASGLDGIAFTDHHHLAGGHHLRELNRRLAPFHIFTGVEITLSEGEDVLVLGVNDPLLEQTGWRYSDLHRLVRRRGGAMILAHPFRFHPSINIDLENMPTDGIEVYSINTAAHNEDKIRALAMQYGLALFADSDAHVTSPLGLYYNEIQLSEMSDACLVEQVRSGRTVPKMVLPQMA